MARPFSALHGWTGARMGAVRSPTPKVASSNWREAARTVEYVSSSSCTCATWKEAAGYVDGVRGGSRGKG
eukprot:6798266-Prymnesium_polylepis.1